MTPEATVGPGPDPSRSTQVSRGPGSAEPSGFSVIRRLVPLLGIRPGRLVGAVVLGATAVVAAAALLGLSGYLICRAAQQPPILSLTVVIVLVRALALLRPGARYAERLVAHDLAFRSLARLRTGVFAHIEPLAPAGLAEFRDGELLSRMVGDIDELQDLTLRILLPVAVALTAGAGIVVGLALMSPVVAVVVLVGLVVGAAGPAGIAYRIAAHTRSRQAQQRARLTADLIDALGAAPELWLNGADGRVVAGIADDDATLVSTALADARASGLAEAVSLVIAGLTAVVVLWLSVRSVATSGLDPLLVAPLVFVTIASFEAVLPLSASARLLPAVLGAGRRVLDLVDRPPMVIDPAQPEGPLGPRPAIELHHLCVDRPTLVTDPSRPHSAGPGSAPDAPRPPADAPQPPADADAASDGGGRRPPAPGAGFRVIDDLDLTLEPGDRVVVVGPSGVGKSTLTEVLVRFLERSGGEALLGGHDLRALDQQDVRSAVVLSAQDPHVFDSSIRENVLLARPGSTDEEVMEGLRRARLADWVTSLPDGLDTRVGERGRALSGGQRQRLALARALLADPSVLVLDEPTAHLDGATAAALLEDLWSTVGDRSLLLVSHGDPGPFDGCPRLELQ